MKSVSLAMLKAEKAGVFQTPQNLCEERSLVADATVLRLPGILSLPGITLPVPVRARMRRALNKFCHAGKQTYALFQSLASLAKLQQSSSHQSPVGNREHTCRCQAVPTVREPFSSQFPFWERVRSMKSVSLAMLKAGKAGVFQTPQTLCEEDSLVADSRCLFQFRARKSRA